MTRVCGKKFKKAWYAKEHMKIHTSERPFQCWLCGKEFSLQKYLANHTNKCVNGLLEGAD